MFLEKDHKKSGDVKMKKQLLYIKGWKKALEECMKDEENKELIKKVVFYGIKVMAHAERPENRREAQRDFMTHSAIKQTVAMLTPNEFMQLFPITKFYKGEKFGLKDYYYTMEYVEEFGAGEPLGENALMFMMEYNNRDVDALMVNQMLCLNDLREYDGHLYLLEEFMAADGKETPNTFKNSKGEAMYVRNGKLEKIEMNKNIQLVN